MCADVQFFVKRPPVSVSRLTKRVAADQSSGKSVGVTKRIGETKPVEVTKCVGETKPVGVTNRVGETKPVGVTKRVGETKRVATNPLFTEVYDLRKKIVLLSGDFCSYFSLFSSSLSLFMCFFKIIILFLMFIISLTCVLVI